MVLVVKGPRVSVSLIKKKIFFFKIGQQFKDHNLIAYDLHCRLYKLILTMKCVSLHGNHGHRRERRSRTGSKAHDGNAPCDDSHGPGDGRDNHDHSRRGQQASRQEATQHWPS